MKTANQYYTFAPFYDLFLSSILTEWSPRYHFKATSLFHLLYSAEGRPPEATFLELPFVVKSVFYYGSIRAKLLGGRVNVSLQR
jgi:hypothetical protein